MHIPRTHFTLRLLASVALVGCAALAATAPASAATTASSPIYAKAIAGSEMARVAWLPPLQFGSGTFVKYEVVTASGAAACESTDKAVRQCDALNLTAGTAYQFKVRVVNSAGSGPFSPLSEAVTPFRLASAPAAPKATAGDKSAQIDWDAPTDLGSGSFVRYEAYGPGPTKVCETTTVTATECTATGLTNDRGHWFAVRAVTSAGAGAMSPASNYVVPTAGPGPIATAPIYVKAVAGSEAARVAWLEPSSFGSGTFVKYEAVTASGAAACESTDKAVRQCDVSNLTAGTSYQFKVRVVTSAGAGAYSPLSEAVTPYRLASAPPAPKATAGDKSAKIDWDAPSDLGSGSFVRYEVYGPGPAKVCETTTVTATECTATGLPNDRGHWFAVRAITTAGAGAMSPVSNYVLPKAP
jgi:predicted phage tail protein